MESRSSDHQIRIVKIMLGVMVSVVLVLALCRDFDHDEFEAIHSAWKVAQGETIYIEFFQHHHPFFYYTLAPIIELVGENTFTPLVLRVLMFGCFLVMLWCGFNITDLVFKDRMVSWLGTLFLACMAMFGQKAVEVRPDVPQVMFGLLSILFLFRLAGSDKKQWLYISAICMGLSFLFLQKTIFIVAGVGLMQLYWMYEGKFSFKQLVFYWLVFGITIAPYFLYLLMSGQLKTYFFWNWVLNMNFEGSFSAWNAIIDSFYYNHFIWIFFLIGLMTCLRRGLRDVPLLSLVLLGTVFLVRAPYRQYFMPFLPFMCAIAAYGMTQVLKYKQKLVAIGLVFLVPVIFLVRTIIVYPNGPQLEKVAWVLEQTEPGDYVYDGDIYFNLYRKDIDFFWYSTEPGKGGLGTYQRLKPYTYDINSSIQKYRPRIVSTCYVENVLDSNTLEQYQQSKVYNDLYVRLK